MVGEEPLVVTLLLERGVEPIRGAVRAERAQRPFSGWVELAAALDASVAAADERQHPEGTDER